MTKHLPRTTHMDEQTHALGPTALNKPAYLMNVPFSLAADIHIFDPASGRALKLRPIDMPLEA